MCVSKLKVYIILTKKYYIYTLLQIKYDQKNRSKVNYGKT